MRPAIRGYSTHTAIAKRFPHILEQASEIRHRANRVVPVEDETFRLLLEQVRELHRLTDEATRESEVRRVSCKRICAGTTAMRQPDKAARPCR